MKPKNSIKKLSQNKSILIGNKIRLARLTRGYNQTFIGEKLGITFQQVQKYEKGTNRISAPKLFQFAQLVRYPIAYFFTDLLEVESKYKEFEEKIKLSQKVPEKDIYKLNKFFLKISNSNIRKNIINITKNFSNSLNSEDGQTKLVGKIC